MGNNHKQDEPRISLQAMRVLNAFLADTDNELAGSDIARLSSLASGTLYPILLRFESAGWLKSRWEDLDPAQAGRPRRRLYRFTPTGIARASLLMAEFGRAEFGREVPA